MDKLQDNELKELRRIELEVSGLRSRLRSKSINNAEKRRTKRQIGKFNGIKGKLLEKYPPEVRNQFKRKNNKGSLKWSDIDLDIVLDNIDELIIKTNENRNLKSRQILRFLKNVEDYIETNSRVSERQVNAIGKIANYYDK